MVEATAGPPSAETETRDSNKAAARATEEGEEEALETHAPFQVHLQHLQTDHGLLRLLLHVNTVDAGWFSHTLRQKVPLPAKKQTERAAD